MMRIKIIGGGIAGLTAAINLKKAGMDVEVHERKRYCGKHTGDFQFLENWTFKNDALDMLRSMNVQTDFYVRPRHTQEAVSPSGKLYFGTSHKPAIYLVKRGRSRDSIDRSLESQCLQMGVKLVFNSKLKSQEADIIATGIKKPEFIATSVMFPCEHAYRSVLIFDDNLSKEFYSYFIVNDNVGEITCVNPVGRKDHIARLEKTVQRCEKIFAIKVKKNIERYSAPLSFKPLRTARKNDQYYVGEAAGFQDCFLGFGMMYAFKSGYLAAKSLLEDLDYNQLIENELLKPMLVSCANRALWAKLSNTGYERVIRLLNSRNPIVQILLGGSDLRKILKKVYNHSLSAFLRPLLFL
jgi:flavin-dependent dehydrogenase